MMIHYNRVTTLRNRERERDLRKFRRLVEAYFEQSAYETDDLPVDWEAAQRARAQINRMLPRIAQVVKAARPKPDDFDMRDIARFDRNAEAISDMFVDGNTGVSEVDVLDAIDVVIGIYEANQAAAFFRTFNPFHHAGSLMRFVFGFPGRVLLATGIRQFRGERPLPPGQVAQLEAQSSQLREMRHTLDTRMAEMQELHERQMAENADHVAELAERVDFAERMIAQRTPGQPDSQAEGTASTPA